MDGWQDEQDEQDGGMSRVLGVSLHDFSIALLLLLGSLLGVLGVGSVSGLLLGGLLLTLLMVVDLVTVGLRVSLGALVLDLLVISLLVISLLVLSTLVVFLGLTSRFSAVFTPSTISNNFLATSLSP